MNLPIKITSISCLFIFPRYTTLCGCSGRKYHSSTDSITRLVTCRKRPCSPSASSSRYGGHISHCVLLSCKSLFSGNLHTKGSLVAEIAGPTGCSQYKVEYTVTALLSHMVTCKHVAWLNLSCRPSCYCEHGLTGR